MATMHPTKRQRGPANRGSAARDVEECCVCCDKLTEFGNSRRTNSFACARDTLCSRCDETLFRRADDRCPLCRAARRVQSGYTAEAGAQRSEALHARELEERSEQAAGRWAEALGNTLFFPLDEGWAADADAPEGGARASAGDVVVLMRGFATGPHAQAARAAQAQAQAHGLWRFGHEPLPLQAGDVSHEEALRELQEAVRGMGVPELTVEDTRRGGEPLWGVPESLWDTRLASFSDAIRAVVNAHTIS